jgi:hypothetical protein
MPRLIRRAQGTFAATSPVHSAHLNHRCAFDVWTRTKDGSRGVAINRVDRVTSA